MLELFKSDLSIKVLFYLASIKFHEFLWQIFL